MRRTLLATTGFVLLVSLPSCASEPKRNAAKTPEPERSLWAASVPPAGARALPDATERTSCIIIQGDVADQPTSVEGVLMKASDKTTAAPFVLRLDRPRCVVGLEHASFVVDVYVASAGADLRPLVDARLRMTGDTVGGTNDLGGPAIVLLAKDIERLAPVSRQP